ncbi:branched-chain amino acid ABC transporter ATP-binding protein, partial [Curtobacterium oceanosedimentum]
MTDAPNAADASRASSPATGGTAATGATGATATIDRGEPVLTAKNLVAGYLPGVNILNGCDLDCYPGELIGIIGPNGAGKS